MPRRLCVFALHRVGPGAAAGGPAPARGHASRTRRPGRSWPPTPGTTSSPGAWPSPTPASRSAPRPATAPPSWGGTARLAPARGARATRRSPGASAPGSIPARRCRSRVALAPGETRRVVFLLGEGRDAAHVRELVGAARPAPRPRTPRWSAVRARLGRDAGRGAGPHARRLLRPPHEPLAPATRTWAAGCGRAPATTSRAAPSASATSSRTSMALVLARPELVREHLLRAAARQFQRGRRAALVAPAQRPGHPHALLGRPALAALRGRALRPDDGRRRRARRARPVPRRRRCSAPDAQEAYAQPQRLGRGGDALRALRARPRPRAHRRAPTACRSWAAGTGTTG